MFYKFQYFGGLSESEAYSFKNVYQEIFQGDKFVYNLDWADSIINVCIYPNS